MISADKNITSIAHQFAVAFRLAALPLLRRIDSLFTNLPDMRKRDITRLQYKLHDLKEYEAMKAAKQKEMREKSGTLVMMGGGMLVTLSGGGKCPFGEEGGAGRGFDV